LHGGEIINCTNLADIFGDTTLGRYAPNYAGGICGEAKGGISYCINNGSICGGAYVGGIVGYIEALKFFRYCGNAGKINGRIYNLNLNHETYMGGIAGYIKGRDTMMNTHIGFINIGHVDGHNYGYVGGIVGCLDSNGLDHCINAGMVDGHRTYVGGIVGYMSERS